MKKVMVIMSDYIEKKLDEYREELNEMDIWDLFGNKKLGYLIEDEIEERLEERRKELEQEVMEQPQ